MRNLLFAAALLATTLGTAARAADGDEAAVLKFEHDLCAAFQRGDVEAIMRAEDENYTLTNSSSHVSTRADDIAETKSGDYRYSEFRNSDMKVRFYGDTAIVLGITSLKGTVKGKPFEAKVRFTDTLYKRNGEWKIIAGHVTKLENPG